MTRARAEKAAPRLGCPRLVALSLGLVVSWGCGRDPEPETKKPAATTAAAAPRRLYLPEDFDPSAPVATPTPRRRCPEEMVLVRDAFCIDRYEVSLVDGPSARWLSPHYPPTRKYVSELYERFSKIPARPPAALSPLSVPEPPAYQLAEDFEARAVSRRDVLPAGYLSRGSAQAVCARTQKRLCSRDEWVTACRGESDRDFPYGNEYRAAACNVHRKSHPARLLHGDASKNHLDPRLGLTGDEDGPLLRATGATPSCRSPWGDDAVYDMVGNLDEWIEEPEGSFLGGFYSRATTAGCAASIDLHGPDYLDYSLGTRCCASPGD